MAKAKSNILVVSLGGTITSEIKGGIVRQAGLAWGQDFFSSIDDRFNYSIAAPAGYSSENATVSDYRMALSGIVSAIESTRPDGILILHGTDSIAYFAQLAVRVLSHINRPVVITGSKLPPSEKNSDAAGNIKLALGFLGAAIDGNIGSKTFGIVFRDSFMGESTFVHASGCQSPDIMGDIRSFMDSTAKKKPDFRSSEYKKRAEAFISGAGVKGGIMSIPAAPGIPYGSYSLEGVEAILIESYHSGTADSKGLEDLVRRAADRNIPCYMGPCPARGNIYESRKKLEDAGVRILSNMPFEGCWAEVVMG